MSNNLRSDLTGFDFKSLMRSWYEIQEIWKSIQVCIKVVLAKILEDHEKFADS